MSAGDPRILGSIGSGGALYTEMANSPRVSYELEDSWKWGCTYVKKTLTRTFICLKKDIQTVLASLTVIDANISSVASGVDSSGALQTVDYGSGWRLISVETPPTNSTTCEINLKYEKRTPTVFEFGLPANVSVIHSGGKVTFKYGTKVLEVWDSGKSLQTKGLTTNVYRYGTLSASSQQVSPVTSYGVLTTPAHYVQNKMLDFNLGGAWNTFTGVPLSSSAKPIYDVAWDPSVTNDPVVTLGTDYQTTVTTHRIPLYRLEILLNDVLMETVDQTEENVPLGPVRFTQRYPTTGFLDEELSAAQMEELRLSYGTSATIEAKIVRGITLGEWVEKTVYIIGWDTMMPIFDPFSAALRANQDMIFDVSVSGRLRLIWWGLIVRDWDIT